MLMKESFRTDLFLSAFQYSAIGKGLVSLDGQWLEVNDALCGIVGYSRTELKSISFQDITHPNDLEQDLTLASQLANGEIPFYHLEKRYIRKDGSIAWVHLTGSLARDDDGSPDFFIAQVVDITARKQLEFEREAFFELSPDFLAIIDKEGFFEQVSPAWTYLLGWSQEELTASPFIDFVHPDDRRTTTEKLHALAKRDGNDRFRSRYRMKNGSYVLLEWNARCTTQQRFYCIARDITEQNEEAEKKDFHIRTLETASGLAANDIRDCLPERASDFFLAAQLFEASPNAIEILTPHGHVLSLNQASRVCRGIKLDEDISYLYWVSLWHEDIRVRASACIEQACAGKRAEITAYCESSFGERTYWDTSLIPLYDKHHKVVRLLAVSHNVTELHQEKTRAEHAAGQLHQLIESNILGFVEYNLASGRFTKANDGFLNMIGWTREEFEREGITWTEITPPEWIPLSNSVAKHLREVGAIVGSGVRAEL
ncbi:PAS domain S-box protein [Noviherbaspirillum sp. CPCC 100848]|uniref:histidine kinase n=1 Tax=Noviherbaspirillum album TaxID=3080276 RepID=A0ABU6JJ92_9BURK|nr:PAS domain S-box protein [Noviherbaspirillum sp. CPCC 100848]MEC4723773.1 PAS domain S-box protein [Noviherbaspirillum sp. CPCC 100848]